MCIKIYAVSAGGNPAVTFGALSVNASLVVQTTQQTESSLLILNNGTAPVHILGIYISGTNGIYGNDTTDALPLGALPLPGAGIWVGGGQLAAVQIGLGNSNECGADQTSLKCFTWTTDQTYVVTVTTSTGQVYTGTFLSP